MDTTARVARDERFVPSPEHARLSALGFDAALADFYWLKALQLVGGERERTEVHAPMIARLVDVVTSVDPWVDHPYRFAAVWLTDSPERVRHANRILERGIAYHPLDWRNRYHLGFNLFFYFEDNERAADVFETALPLEGTPRYLAPLVARLRAESGGIDVAAAFLAHTARTTDDEFERAEALKALDEIETERRARFLDRARLAYRERNGRDIERVEDLAAGPGAVLRALPAAHPVFDNWGWTLDEKSGEIVSSFYGSRYELHLHPSDRARRARWRMLWQPPDGERG